MKTASAEVLDALANTDLDPAIQEVLLEFLPDSGADDTDEDSVGRLYLESVEVRGFRGIGGVSRIDFSASPGLTVVVGGNGTGKSSFAESIERVVTGTTARWETATPDAKSGWRNVHTLSDDPMVRVRLGQSDSLDPIDIELRWASEDEFGQGARTTVVGSKTVEQQDLPGRIKHQAEIYPPMLPYAQLDAVVNGNPAELFDAFNPVLGLAPLDEAAEMIGKGEAEFARKLRDETLAREGLSEVLAACTLEPARDIEKYLEHGEGRDEFSALVAEIEVDPAGGAVKAVLEMDLELEREREATAELVELAAKLDADTAASRVAETSDLLEAALEVFTAGRGDGSSCPVCEVGTLDRNWADRASERLAQMRDDLKGRNESVERLDELRRSLVDKLQPFVNVPSIPGLGGLDELSVRSAELLESLTAPSDATALNSAIEDVERLFALSREEAQRLSLAIKEEMKPVVEAARRWDASVEAAGNARLEKRVYGKAKKWLRDEISELRTRRMTSLSDVVSETWSTLSPGASIEMSPLGLSGAVKRRKLDMKCTIDGESLSARSIMSQGELHALALSVFLPRALHQRSPFGFLMIDDPIHALDEIKIEGLAEVLHEISKTRQVVVLTHDRRLETTLGALGYPAQILRLRRGDRSEVIVEYSSDEVTEALRDARALSADPEIGPEIRLRAVAGCCRTAVENAAVRHYWQVSRDSGLSMDEAQSKVSGVTTMWEKVSLALYGGRQPRLKQQIERDYSADASSLLDGLSHSGHVPIVGFTTDELPEATARPIASVFLPDGVA